MKKIIDMSGRTAGKWKVIEKAGNKKSGAALWLCRCACGNTAKITGGDLRSGKSSQCKSCKGKAAFTTHGMTGQRIYRIWKSLQQRCKSGKASYALESVQVCKEWARFEPFCEWAHQNGYSDELTIERLDNSKGYSPANCIWADALTQAANRSIVRKTESGEPLFVVAEKNGISKHLLASRIHDGWEPLEAATRPKGIYRKPRIPNRCEKTGRALPAS